ncbi:MAG TPA: HD domain-containing protein [bacterium]|nr:HD domain-containing protein [bacterium]
MMRRHHAVLVILGAAIVIAAINPFGLQQGLFVIIAALLVCCAGFLYGWVNGVLMAVLFGFTKYSFAAQPDVISLILNSAFLSFLGVFSSMARGAGKKERTKRERENDRLFVNKIINSMMAAHEMLYEVRSGINRETMLRIFGTNLSNLLDARDVFIYKKNGERFELDFCAGMKKIKPSVSLSAQAVKGALARSISASGFPEFSDEKNGFLLLLSAGEENGTGELAVICREKPFEYSDIYMAEFFTAQVFMIVENNRLFEEIKINYESLVQALSLAIDTKDHETHGHSLETMCYAVKIAEKLGLPREEQERIKYASLLHDIGKINISSKILNKPGPLTDREYDRIKKHPEEGVSILKKLNIFSSILPIISHHHEHMDGKGYPFKATGEEIPLGARICAIADAYSVMRSDRPYRKAMPKEAAVEELKRCAGSQFDSRLVDVFLEIIGDEEQEGFAAEKMDEGKIRMAN